MSNAIYMVASLPMLQYGEQPPLSLEDFRFRCMGVLSETELSDLDAILRGEPSEHPFGIAYHACVSQMSNSTAKSRALQWGSEARFTERMHPGFDVALSHMISDALGRNTPLEREEELDKARWWVAEQLAGIEDFSMAHVYAFAIKLKMNERYASFDTETGNQVIDKVIQANDRAVVQF